jgi:hypothetical protein
MAVSVKQESELIQSTASGTWTFNFASAVTAGNVVVLIGLLRTASRTFGVPTSSGSATFSQVVSSGTSIFSLWMWSAVENGSGNTQYQTTIAGTLTAAGLFQGYELEGADGAAATSSDANVGQASSTSPRMTTASGLTIPTGGIMVGAITTSVNGSWGTLTDPANFTRDYQTNTGTAASTFIGNSTTAASGVTGTATITTARGVNGLAAVWSEAVAGGQPLAKRLGGIPHNGFRRRGMW